MTLEQADAEDRVDKGLLKTLLLLHGMRVTDRSYAVKALEAAMDEARLRLFGRRG